MDAHTVGASADEQQVPTTSAQNGGPNRVNRPKITGRAMRWRRSASAASLTARGEWWAKRADQLLAERALDITTLGEPVAMVSHGVQVESQRAIHSLHCPICGGRIRRWEDAARMMALAPKAA
jgi:predicted RNA-binding Zn-ribbon protein involved in translation (DUF1610 family)